MENKNIYITLVNGAERVWNRNSYTEYELNDDLFVVLNNEQWIGIYPMREVRSIEIHE